MNDPLEPENRLEADLARIRLAPPSADLREQVLDIARKAWDDATASAELPWRLPVLRLAGCVTAATLLIALANLADGHSAANRQTRALQSPHPVADVQQRACPQLPAWPVDRSQYPRREVSQDVVRHVQRMERLLRGDPELDTRRSPQLSPHTWLRSENASPFVHLHRSIERLRHSPLSI